MSMFNIKLKTKNGNDIKKKQTITVFFRINYKKGVTTTAEYTYRIMYNDKVDDPKIVLGLKKARDVRSLEDLTLKVMLNFCHIIGQFTNKHKIDPDFIIFISPDFERTDAWKFLNSAFKRPGKQQDNNHLEPLRWMRDITKDYEEEWTIERCKRYKIKKDELDMLKSFADLNPNTKFMTIDPNRDPKKYARSITICKSLQDRIKRDPQIEVEIEEPEDVW